MTFFIVDQCEVLSFLLTDKIGMPDTLIGFFGAKTTEDC